MAVSARRGFFPDEIGSSVPQNHCLHFIFCFMIVCLTTPRPLRLEVANRREYRRGVSFRVFSVVS